MPKRPAWGAIPPSATAFSSCTSPCTTRPRHGSFSVGAIRGKQRGRRTIERVLHPERVEQAPARQLSERRAGQPLDDVAEQDHAQVAVDGFRAGRVGEIHRHDPLDVGRLALHFLVERRPPHEASRVREQLPDPDLVLGPALEGREEARDASVEVELALVHQHHRERGGHDDLRQAGEVVDRVVRDCRGPLVVGQAPERPQVHESALVPDPQHRARKRARREAALDHRVHGLEPAGPEAVRRARGVGAGGHRLRITEERERGRDSPAHHAPPRHGARRDGLHREPAPQPPEEPPGADTSCGPKA